MSPALQVAIALGSVAALLAVMLAVKRTAARFDWPAEVQRKSVHMATGLYTLTLPWLFPERWPVYMLVAVSLVVLMVLRLPGVARHGIGSTLHSVERQSAGDILLTVSVGICFFLSLGEKVIYVLPMAVLTLADAAAALAGTAYGKRFYMVEEGRKSLEGVAVFFMITLIVSMVCLLLMTDVSREKVIVLSLTVSAIGTIIEAESWRGLDNFFLPIGLLLYLHASLDSENAALLAELGVLVVAIAGGHILARNLDLGTHTIRVYVIVAFLLLVATDAHNALLPLVALIAHAYASRHAPCEGGFPHLDMATALAFVSIGWLALGTATGFNAILFYESTVAGMAIAFLAIAHSSGPRRRMAAVVACGVVLAGAVVLLVDMNQPDAHWAGDHWLLAAATIGWAALAATMATAWLRKRRAFKVSLLSLVVPIGAYLVLVLSDAGDTIG